MLNACTWMSKKQRSAYKNLWMISGEKYVCQTYVMNNCQKCMIYKIIQLWICVMHKFKLKKN